jgi:hypothetical protein
MKPLVSIIFYTTLLMAFLFGYLARAEEIKIPDTSTHKVASLSSTVHSQNSAAGMYTLETEKNLVKTDSFWAIFVCLSAIIILLFYIQDPRRKAK